MDVRRVGTDELGAIAAEYVVAAAREAVAARGEFIVAFSGGTTPAPMFDALASADLPWDRTHILQVDERVAPDDDPARNLTGLQEHLLSRIAIPSENVHPMPVGIDDLDGALRAYCTMLRRVAGDPPTLDVAHLGLGADGHTASLTAQSVAGGTEERLAILTAEIAGHRRMTLTPPVLDRARRRLWVISGTDKRAAVRKLLAGDRTIPAGQLRREDSTVVLDPDADPERISDPETTAP